MVGDKGNQKINKKLQKLEIKKVSLFYVFASLLLLIYKTKSLVTKFEFYS